MQKINELTSTDVVQHNIEKLKELFPTAVSEGKLLVEELQALMGEYIEKEKEYYQMTWAGKTEAQKEANKVSTGTLRPAKDESKDWDTTGNIVIEGDNLEVLKLLQKTYSNKVKMIYIDPPYNTGNDFVYKDNYKDNLSYYLELTGQTDKEGRKLSSNTDSDGRYHSNWLNMMYPRLKLARNLLTDDGVIFISIDDNEQTNLKKMCDEIFGEENFLAQFIWTGKSGSEDDGNIRNNHEYCISFCKSISDFEVGLDIKTGESFPLFDDNKNDNFKRQLLRKWGDNSRKEDRPNLYYPIIDDEGNEFYPTLPNNEPGCWRWSREKMNKAINDGLIEFDFNRDQKKEAYEKIFESDQSRRTKKFQSLLVNASSTSNGTKEFRKLFDGKRIFDRPKPTGLITYIIEIANLGNNSIVLDFFSGSGTTAHATIAVNAEKGHNRKCISVQLPEPTDEKSEAYKAGYTNIAEITKERIRRAGELIKEEHKDKEGIENLDVGFRVFKLDSSNIKAWDTSVENFEEQLDMFSDNNGENIKPSRTEEDILFEILLKYGLELTVPIIEKQIEGNKVYNIGFGSMYICLDDKVNPEVAKGIGVWHKEEFTDNNPSVIFKDNGFATDADKTNTVQTLKQFGISNVKSI